MQQGQRRDWGLSSVPALATPGLEPLVLQNMVTTRNSQGVHGAYHSPVDSQSFPSDEPAPAIS